MVIKERYNEAGQTTSEQAKKRELTYSPAKSSEAPLIKGKKEHLHKRTKSDMNISSAKVMLEQFNYTPRSPKPTGTKNVNAV